MSVPRPVVDEKARQALDAVEHPLSIATAIRAADDSIVDFSFVFLNRAAGAWAALAPDAVRGMRATTILPILRSSGLFDALARVVETGQPFSQSGERYEGVITGGAEIDGRYDVYAVRLGDGYLSAWRQLPDADEGDSDRGDAPDQAIADLRDSVARARAAVRLVRLESRPATARLRLGFGPA